MPVTINFCASSQDREHDTVIHMIVGDGVSAWRQCKYCHKQGSTFKFNHYPSVDDLKKIHNLV